MHLMRKQVELAQASGNRDAVVEASLQMRKFMRDHKVNPLRMLVAPLLNLPLSLFYFWALQSLCADAEKVEGFANGGTLWFEQLGAPDPYGLIPLASTVLTLSSIQLSASLQTQDQSLFGWSAGAVRNFMRGSTVVFGVVAASFPAGLTLSFASTALVMLTTNALSRTRPIHYLFGFPEGFPNDVKPIFPPGLSPQECERLLAESKAAAAQTQANLFGQQPAPRQLQQTQPYNTSNIPTPPLFFTPTQGLHMPNVPPPPPPPLNTTAATTTATKAASKTLASSAAAPPASPAPPAPPSSSSDSDSEGAGSGSGSDSEDAPTGGKVKRSRRRR
jgi:60Kd inner membrane protein